MATSAVREAANANVFLDRAREEAGIEIEVISGVEEARLIHLGVLQAVPVFDRRLLLVDIGGGSTELLIGEKGETLAARSFKLGAVRLTDRFFPGGTVTAEGDHGVPRATCSGILSHFQREVDQHGFDVAVASSGTAEAVAHLAHALDQAPSRCARTTASRCRSTTSAPWPRSSSATARLTARAKVPGLEPGRADIAVAGALILETVATTFGVEAFTFSEAALRDGRAGRHDGAAERSHGQPPRPAPPARRVAAQHPPARRALRRRSGPLGPRRPPRRRAVRRPGAAARPRRHGPASTSRPAPCWPTSGSSSPTASTTCTPTT